MEIEKVEGLGLGGLAGRAEESLGGAQGRAEQEPPGMPNPGRDRGQPVPGG